LGPDVKIAFRVARDCAVLCFRRALANRNGIDDLARALVVVDFVRTPTTALRPQSFQKLSLQHSSSLNEQAAISLRPAVVG
jgi:hypothetical protein